MQYIKATISLSILLIFITGSLTAQRINFEDNPDKNLFIRLYGELDFTKKIEKDVAHNGIFEARRIVPVIGYQFNRKLQFMTEIEIEHGDEIFVEQAHLKYQLASNLHLRTGMMIIPMGHVNENHEPTAYYSVLRPDVDKYIVPTTWRELGAGVSGRIPSIGINYQAILFNGFKSYEGSSKLASSSGIRGGRQKGLSSFLYGLPNQSLKLEYYNINNLKIGLSIYNGKTQSTLYEGLDLNNSIAVAQADSSVINTLMFGFTGSYSINKLNLRAQWIQTYLSNTSAYNAFGGSDLGDRMYGYYLEASYALIQTENGLNKFSIFARYSDFDRQARISNEEGSNQTHKFSNIVYGLNWAPSKGVVYKMDMKHSKNALTGNTIIQFATGFGVWF